jgi:hypothetical protein
MSESSSDHSKPTELPTSEPVKPSESASGPLEPSEPPPDPPKASEHSSAPAEQRTEGWAPDDYFDGRKRWEWPSRYPDVARKGIRREATYLIIVTIGYLLATAWTVRHCNGVLTTDDIPKDKSDVTRLMNLSFVAAWVGGAVGGCCFGIKWMYHSVAKGLWHEDRCLWRILTPHLSGIVSVFMVF